MNIRIRNWDKFQHPDVARGKQRAPRWIKVYTELMGDPAFLELTMHQRGVLLSIWLAYATGRRQLSDNTSTLARQLGHRVLKRDLEALNHAGFIDLSASNLQAENQQPASLEESRREVPTNVGTRRAQDEHWEALIRAVGRDPETVIERKRWNTALKELRDAGASPDDIEARAASYKREWPDVEFTPHGLAANWSRFGASVTVLRPFVCEVCQIGFSTAAKRRDHMANVHDQEAADHGGVSGNGSTGRGCR